MGWCPACISPSLAGEQPCYLEMRGSQGPAAWPLPVTAAPSCARGSFRDEKLPRVPVFGGWRKGGSECSSPDRMTCRREPWDGCCHLAAVGEATCDEAHTVARAEPKTQGQRGRRATVPPAPLSREPHDSPRLSRPHCIF